MGQNILLTPPTYFQGVKAPNPQDLRLWRRVDCTLYAPYAAVLLECWISSAVVERMRSPECTSSFALHCLKSNYKQAVRVATQYAPAPLLPRGRPSASHAAEQTQRSSTFPRRIRSHADHCSRLTR